MLWRHDTLDHPLYALYMWCIKGDIALADPSTPTIVQLIVIESHRKLTAKPGSAGSINCADNVAYSTGPL